MANIGRIELLILSMVCLAPIAIALAAAVVVWLVRRERVPCPYCGERIRREARVCRYCGRDLPPPPREEASSPPGGAEDGQM